MTYAVSQLEREKARLEEQLRLVNTHLAAYRALQAAPQRPAAAAPPSRALPPSSPPPASASRVSPAGNRDMGRALSPRNATLSPTRNRSPARAAASVAASPSVQTEQIYEELRQIRRAREEREAQRRAAVGATSPVRL